MRYSDVVQTLTKLSLTSVKPEARQQALALKQSVEKFEFIFLLHVWEKILRHVRVVSKLLQSQDVDLSLVTNLLATTDKHFRDLRAAFTTVHDEATAFADKHGADKQFQITRQRKVKRFHDECHSDECLVNTMDIFRVTVFNVTLDSCISQLQTRFNSVRTINERFGFIMPKELGRLSDDDLIQSATQFAKTYKDDISEDIVSQFLSLRSCYDRATGPKSPRDMLQFIVENRLESSLPDVVTCYMLFLTLPVTVASCERSFSKLRIIKNYLRSSCGQERLSSLALLSIESKVARSLDANDLIADFASRKARRKL